MKGIAFLKKDEPQPLISDADSTFLPEGGQPHQLLNVGLKLAAMFCSKVSINKCHAN